jgi:predicted RNA polymerase sigma factor
VPPNPGAWLTVTARNRALDRLRRERRPAEKTRLLDAPRNMEETNERTFPDERLELIFTLTLRALGGLRTEEIARAFLLAEETMKRRLSRAKRKIRDGGLVLGLGRLTGSPVVDLNRTIAVAEAAGTQSGLELVDRLDLGGYRYFHSTRADLLRRRVAEASGSR